MVRISTKTQPGHTHTHIGIVNVLWCWVLVIIEVTNCDLIMALLCVYTYNIHTYLGIYKTRSATTKPTVTNKLVAGRNGTTNSRNPSTSGM